ncbi:hypothetical protein BOX15_Mlig028860g1 [Macrostomum lignano]|uniref:Uncharacterized protein n=1 Tax=Macrostomum lignano TaxID=282301 RepID=A0A267F707_9PLAT|nr:hypothetical protein BOX15_Mlig028860g1 [Macrostomum lignano]
MDPQAEFIEHDNVRLPPQLPELQKYTENLRQLLEQRGIRGSTCLNAIWIFECNEFPNCCLTGTEIEKNSTID